MNSLLIITTEPQRVNMLHSGLIRKGFSCSVATTGSETIKHIARQSPELVLLEVNGNADNSEFLELSRKLKHEKQLPVVALISREIMDSIDSELEVDDFAIKPYDLNEVTLRIRRLLHRTSKSTGLLKCGELTIDMTKCEVTISGKPIVMTFREYQLLKFLASNRGRVFSRDALLNKVWGYDYFGGDRTVDVHIRRLRSKIEASGQSFINTVRNIGYRFN